MRRFARLLSVVVCLGFGLTPAFAQDSRQNEPGKFDFYLLSLSWSPTFCEERGESRNAKQQCGERPFSFVVHGLWPQYEKGFPEFCQNPPAFVDNKIIGSMLDLMPARGLIINEWKKHGTCTGLSVQGYFQLVRQVRAAVKIPPDYLDLKQPLTVTPDEIEEAFIKVNPGMTRAGIAVTCNSPRLSEVRICMTRDLKFRECEDVDRRACKREKLVMPPVRGG